MSAERFERAFVDGVYAVMVVDGELAENGRSHIIAFDLKGKVTGKIIPELKDWMLDVDTMTATKYGKTLTHRFDFPNGLTEEWKIKPYHEPVKVKEGTLIPAEKN